jgi:hypothetical protein
VIESFAFTPAVLGSLGLNNPLVIATSILQPTLTSGTPYWITVVANDQRSSLVWNWNSTGDPANQAISTDGGASWFAPSGFTPGAFQIDSPAVIGAPEPAAGLLLAGGLLVVALRKRFA